MGRDRPSQFPALGLSDLRPKLAVRPRVEVPINVSDNNHCIHWNKGKLTGQKEPLGLRHIWAIRVRLPLAHETRDFALFNLAIDSKLRACDLLKVTMNDTARGAQIASRAIVTQQKTKRPVQFEITEQTRKSIRA